MSNSTVTINLVNVRIARDVELKFTANGKSIANFSVAVNQWDAGSKAPVTRFLDCEGWELPEAMIPLISKGNVVNIVGAQLNFREYTKRDGTVAKTERVSVSKFNMFFDSAAVVRDHADAGLDDQGDMPFE